MLYKFACFVVRWFYKIFFFARITGLENLPKEGGYAFCGNHKSNHDAPLVASFVKTKMNFLSKKEACDAPVLGAFLKKVGAISIDRDKKDIAAIKESLRVMKSGMGLMVFPQGTRMKKVTPESVKPGILSMAHKAGVHVIPFGIAGNFRLFGGVRVFLHAGSSCGNGVRVNIGKPITVEEIGKILETEGRAEMNSALSNLLYTRIKELAEE